jgi:hypothetical protein
VLSAKMHSTTALLALAPWAAPQLIGLNHLIVEAMKENSSL